MHSCFNYYEVNKMNLMRTDKLREQFNRTYFYFNLNKHVWSCMQRGRVIRHAEFIAMKDCEFRVRPGGHKRVIETGKKNVHAFAIADMWTDRTLPDRSNAFYEALGFVEISYNPFKADHFYVKATGERVDHAERVMLFANKRVMALNPKAKGS